MDTPKNQQRIVSIHQMLFDMARGSFSNRIPLSGNEDELETITVLINMVAEELQDSVFHMGYINSRTHPIYNQYSIILNQDLIIKTSTPEFSIFLGEKLLDGEKYFILDYLSECSKNKIVSIIENNEFQVPSLTLEFQINNHLLESVCCNFNKLNDSTDYILTLFIPTVIKNNIVYPDDVEKEKHHRTKKSDALLIQKLYDYILANLEEPLPSIKEFARMFGTNECKLKEGFRHFFKTSIYQFYNEERLKRAHFMVEHTTMPLKSIAIMNGFISYPNFSKSFKKRFGVSPKEVHRIHDTPV